jgi:hypothetical protein
MVMYTLTTVDIVGHVAEWLRRGLQILVSQFDSGRGLQEIGCFFFLKKVCCFLFLGSSVGRAVDC